MSDKWLYRISGQEFGPVSLDLVRTLVASGTIAPDDEVRDVNRSNWILACAAWELRDSIRSPEWELTVERRTVRDEWFCRGVAGDFGPLTLSDLIQLAAQGELKPDEEVKARADDYWKQVCSIRRLVELLPFPERLGTLDTHESGFGTTSLNIHDQIERFQRTIQTDLSERTEILPFPGVQPADQLTSKEFEMGFSTESDQGEPYPNLAQKEGSSLVTPENSDTKRNGEVVRPCFDAHTPCPAEFGSSDADFLKKRPDPLERTASSMKSDAQRATGHSLRRNPSSAIAGFNVLSHFDESDSTEAPDQLVSMHGKRNVNWTGWIAGEEFGPVEYSDLLTWAVTGRLSPMDFVRQGDEGQYVPAVNIPCLFTVHAVANSLSRRVSRLAVYDDDCLDNNQESNSQNSEIPKPEAERSDSCLIGTVSSTTLSQNLSSRIRELANDPKSIRISALLAGALIVISWAACL